MSDRTSPLRVGFVIQRLVEGAGTEDQIRLLLRRLPAEGIEPFLCVTGDQAPPDALPLAAPPVILGMRRTVSPAGARGMLRFRSWLKEDRPRVLLSFWRDADLVCAAAGAGIPVVASRRSVGEDYYGHSPRELRRVRLVNRRIARWAANSEAVREYTIAVEGVARAKVAVLPNLLDTERFRPPAPEEREAARRALDLAPDAVVFVCVANLRPVKRHEDLIDAFAEVRRRIPEAALLLVGAGPREGELRGRAAPLGAAVRFLGPRSDPERVLAAADVAVLSSLTEGFPNALLEAAACGLPLVGTEGGGTPELIRGAGAGGTAPAQDPGALAEAMVDVAADPGRRIAHGCAARDFVLARHALGVAVPVWARFLRMVAATG